MRRASAATGILLSTLLGCSGTEVGPPAPTPDAAVEARDAGEGADASVNADAGSAPHDAGPAPQDSDADGVPDDRDRCPGTPAGASVDADGCEATTQPKLTVCAEKPSDWSTVHAHSWDARPAGVRADTAWPGEPMRAAEGAWFCVEYPGVESVNLVFNDNGGAQTSDLSRDRDGCYTIATSQWSDSCPALGSNPPPPPQDADGDGIPDDRDDCPNTPPGTAVDGRGCPRAAGSGDFREETIYFVITTRFFNGDPSNDYYNRDRYKAGDPQWRGDFKGLIEQLDYIQDLGFTAIWITPPVENRSGLDYHGYHPYDWTKVDPRLESPGATYQDFIDAAHARGLKVVQDVVINHSSNYGIRGQVWIDHLPIKYYVPPGSQQGRIDLGPYQGNLGDYSRAGRDDNDNPVAPQWFRDRHTSDPDGLVPLVDPKTGQTVPSPGYDPNRFFGIDAQTLSPDWYHQQGFIAGGDWENPAALQAKHLAGDTIDLATGRANVKTYLNQAIHAYLDMGVDAIRLDTAKHIERDELLTYVDDWKAHKPGLFVFGEVLVKGLGMGSELANDNASAVIRPWWYTRRASNPSDPSSGADSGLSVLDFSLFSTFRDNVTRGGFGQIGGVLGWDWVYGDATQLVTFFQNHDVGPDNDFKYRYGGDPANAALAYNVLWTIRGIPALYYGEEIQFMGGAPQDIAGNSDTLDTTGRAYFGDHLAPGALAQTKGHALFGHIQRLNQIRRAVPALQKAPMSSVQEFGSGLGFVRNLNSGRSVAVVGLAARGGASFNIGGVPDGTYRDAVTGGTLTASGGQLSFQVAGYSAGIWIKDGPGRIGNDGTWLR